jgi:hypothetical protein
MKKNLSHNHLKRHANTTATPYTAKQVISIESQQRLKEDFLKRIEGTATGVYLVRKP